MLPEALHARLGQSFQTDEASTKACYNSPPVILVIAEETARKQRRQKQRKLLFLFFYSNTSEYNLKFVYAAKFKLL